jgi:hypothetical protein
MENKNNIALKTLVLINSDRKQAIKGAPVANNSINGASGNVISIAGYLNRDATPYFGGFAS